MCLQFWKFYVIAIDIDRLVSCLLKKCKYYFYKYKYKYPSIIVFKS